MPFWKSKKFLIATLIFLLLIISISVYFLLIKNGSDEFDKYGRSGPCRMEEANLQPAPPPSDSPEYLKTIGFAINSSRDLDYIQKAKEMGANTITLFIDTEVTDSGVRSMWACVRSHPEVMLGNFINEAHKEGLFVEFREVQAPPVKGIGLKTDQEIIESYSKYWADLAKIAQKYNIYQITTFGELDNSYSQAHKEEIIWTDIKGGDLAPLAQGVLKEIRKYYRGRVGIGLGDPRNIWGKEGKEDFDISGYDQFQFSYYPQPEDTSFEVYFDQLPQILKVSREIADANGIKEIVWGESGVLNPDEALEGFSDWGTASVSEQAEAKYYDRIFKESNDKVEGYNIVSISEHFSVTGEPGEAIIKKWFNQLH